MLRRLIIDCRNYFMCQQLIESIINGADYWFYQLLLVLAVGPQRGPTVLSFPAKLPNFSNPVSNFQFTCQIPKFSISTSSFQFPVPSIVYNPQIVYNLSKKNNPQIVYNLNIVYMYFKYVFLYTIYVKLFTISAETKLTF